MSTTPGVGMMSTGHIAAAAAAAAAAAPAGDFATVPMGSLSVGEAMQYLSTYLSKSDTEIRNKMGELQQSKADAETLGKKIAMLQTLKRNAMDGGDTWARDPALVKQAHELANDPAVQKLLSPEARGTLARLDSHYSDTTMGVPIPGAEEVPGGKKVMGMVEVYDRRVNADDIDAVMKTLTDSASQITSSNELKMIQLQSAISARGNLLSMVSNMVKSFDDSAKSIVGNIR